MTKSFIASLMFLTTTLITQSVWAYDTNDGVGLLISDIQISGSDGYYYFKTTNLEWRAPGCRTAEWVSINPADVVNGSAIFSAALSARMAKQKWCSMELA